jgi:hypothetical protein
MTALARNLDHRRGNQHEPARPQHEHRGHEHLVPGFLRGLEAGGEALGEQRRIAAREPQTDRQPQAGHFREEHPGGRPAHGSGRHEQDARHRGDPHRGLGDQLRNHVRLRGKGRSLARARKLG